MSVDLRFFESEHLPEHLRVVSQQFEVLAHAMAYGLPRGPEVTQCLRDLLRAKDCAVRAVVIDIKNRAHFEAAVTGKSAEER